ARRARSYRLHGRGRAGVGTRLVSGRGTDRGRPRAVLRDARQCRTVIEVLTVRAEKSLWESIAVAASGVLGAERSSTGGVHVRPFDPAMGEEDYVLRRVEDVTE